VAWLAKTVLTEDDKINLKVITLEIAEIRRLIEKLAETMVKISDKELMKIFNANQDEDLKEKQVDKYEEKLERQFDFVEKEFRT
jgi:hypothetical protein